MKKYLKVTLIFVAGMIAAAIPTAYAVSALFSDVSGNEWYAHAVESLSDKGIVKGYEDGTFKADNGVNRAELVVMLDRLQEHQRLLDSQCDRLSSFEAMSWYGALNQKYKDMYWKPLGDSAPVDAGLAGEYGQGCLASGNDIFVFMPGQDAFGCHEIWNYDIRANTLEKAGSKDAYCANYFTDVTNDHVSFTGSSCEGGPCTRDYGKYYIKGNNIEVVSEAVK